MLDHLDRCLLYSSGELAESQRKAHELHRAGCPACRGLEEDLALGTRVAGATRLELPQRARVSAVSGARSSRPAPARAVALAAAVLAALALWPRPRAVPDWNDLDRDVARLGAELDRFSRDLARTESDLEIEADLRRLNGGIDANREGL